MRNAREFVTRQARGCPESVLADVAQCVAELANNAVLHTRSGAEGGQFTVTVYATGTSVRVEVADAGPAGTAMRPGATENGWGLGMVAALAQRVGRVTWFECRW